MRFVSLASGSSGNCTYIGSGRTNILIDAGISCKRITDSLHALDIDPGELDAIFITHEHSDHISGLKTLVKKYGVRVYASAGTVRELVRCEHVTQDMCTVINAGEDCFTGDMTVKPFNNLHDAAQPFGYRVECGPRSVAVATDLGNYTDYTVRNLAGLDAVLLEANHDIRMLETGPYPYNLKRRILSDYGHLCNERSGQLLSDIASNHLKTVILGHLSKENNLPELALMCVRNELNSSDNEFTAKDFDIFAANRDSISRVIEL